MELQLARLPCICTYRAHPLTEWVIQYKAKIPYISLPNILLDCPVIPEVLFEACSPVKLASWLNELIGDKALQEKQIVAAGKVMELICPSKRPVNNFGKQDTGLIISSYSPSMIAASTILGFVKP
ncbi:hypothetical protein SLEP1_g39563 [Rubroshorea leprosula]|nr:hypothetical protein SLEP1_g39563 [Rubroshorea leprosula]